MANPRFPSQIVCAASPAAGEKLSRGVEGTGRPATVRPADRASSVTVIAGLVGE